MKFILQEQSIDVDTLKDGLHGPEEGASVQFLGTARVSSHESPKKVTRLQYEAYSEMAHQEMLGIFNEAREKFGVHKAIVIHRVGNVELTEIAVAIQVSTAHRSEAFLACRYLIDELKKRVPIWKKEFYEDGSDWVSCRP